MQGVPRGRPLFLRIPQVFDIGFSELVVIGLVALIVIGPERRPYAVAGSELDGHARVFAEYEIGGL